MSWMLQCQGQVKCLLCIVLVTDPPRAQRLAIASPTYEGKLARQFRDQEQEKSRLKIQNCLGKQYSKLSVQMSFCFPVRHNMFSVECHGTLPKLRDSQLVSLNIVQQIIMVSYYLRQYKVMVCIYLTRYMKQNCIRNYERRRQCGKCVGCLTEECGHAV